MIIAVAFYMRVKLTVIKSNIVFFIRVSENHSSEEIINDFIDKNKEIWKEAGMIYKSYKILETFSTGDDALEYYNKHYNDKKLSYVWPILEGIIDDKDI